MIARLILSDARRPASWIAAVAAAVVAVALGASVAPLPAVACGGLLAVAAVGDLLAAGPGGELRSIRTVARGAWPLAGLLVAMPIVGWRAASSAGGAALIGGLIAAVACIAALTAARERRAWERWAGAGMRAGTAGPGESWADGLAMASMLAAMAVCYFLAPHRAGWYAAVAAAWFVLLAVPRATLWGGDAAARRGLVVAAVGRPRPPGTAVHAARTLVASACLLGWPAVVAMALRRDQAWSAMGPAPALVLLVALAAVAAAAAAVTERWRLPADTALATTAAALAVFVARTAQVPWSWPA